MSTDTSTTRVSIPAPGTEAAEARNEYLARNSQRLEGPATQAPEPRVNDGAMRYNGDGSVSDIGVRSFNMADATNGETGVLATARAPGSAMPRPVSELQPTDLVTVGGMTTTVANAERIGVLRKNEAGRYVEANAPFSAADGDREENNTETLEEATEENAEDAPQVLPVEGAEDTLREIVEHTNAGERFNGLDQLLKQGEVSEATLNAAASQMQVEPQVLREKVETVTAAFERQAEAAVAKVADVDWNDFKAWANKQALVRLQGAARAHVLERSTKGYEALARDYVADLALHNQEHILNAKLEGGLRVERVGQDIVVFIPGHGSMTYSSAIRAGLISYKVAR